MLSTTIEATKAIFKADHTISTEERAEILRIIRGGGRRLLQSSGRVVGEDRIIPRKAVASLFNRTTRAVDKWAREGLLTRVKLPGRKRSVGFRESEVIALMGGGANQTSEGKIAQGLGNASEVEHVQ